MNRLQRREFFRNMRLKNIPKDVAQVYYDAIDANQRSPNEEIFDGDTVEINVDQIKSGVNYKRMSEEYREFIESSSSRQFKAVVLENKLVSLEGVGKWLFWQGDLMKCKPESEVEQE